MTSPGLVFQKLWESILGGFGGYSAWHYCIEQSVYYVLLPAV